MTWFDVVAILLIVAIAWLESLRGFGRAIFDFVGGIIALKISIVASGWLAQTAPLMSSEASAEAFWMTMIFVVLVVLIVIATKLIYETTLMSLDVLDPVVGGILGVASGIIAAHFFFRVMLTAYADTAFAATVLNSFMGHEIVQFRSYHRVVQALQNLGNW
jgi:uncharacterized membrane protein required for colicin V production